MRSRNLAALVVAAALLVACSDAPTPTRPRMQAPGLANRDFGDWVTWSLWEMYPDDIANQGYSLWQQIRQEYQAGDFDSARRDYLHLVSLVKQWIPYVQPISHDDTQLGNSALLVSMMSEYIFNGGEHATFHHLGPDATFAIVNPGEEQTVVTPSEHAGVFFSFHSAPQTFTLIIDAATTTFPANCSGPLQTARCQYPQFYRFHPYPEVSLNDPAAFGVCHVNTGENRLPLPGSDHNNYRLAHDRPENGNFIEGGTVPTEPGENIEILPLASVSFMKCEKGDDFYQLASASPSGYMDHLASAGRGSLRALATAAEWLLAPEKAYAIDQGGGGFSIEFSNFNVVDPLGVPDLKAAANSDAPPASANPGDVLSLPATVSNIGTATATSDTIEVSLQAIAEVPPPPIVLKTVVATMVPLDPAVPVSVTLPSTIPAGNYTATVRAATANVIPETNLTNNSVSVPVVIGTVIP